MWTSKVRRISIGYYGVPKRRNLLISYERASNFMQFRYYIGWKTTWIKSHAHNKNWKNPERKFQMKLSRKSCWCEWINEWISTNGDDNSKHWYDWFGTTEFIARNSTSLQTTEHLQQRLQRNRHSTHVSTPTKSSASGKNSPNARLAIYLTFH